MKKLMIVLLMAAVMFTSCSNKDIDDDRIKITAVDFPSYDLARAVFKDNADIRMLVYPGGDVHSYEPTPEDAVRIIESDLFIYTGGHSDEWVTGLLKDLGEDVDLFRLVDHVPLIEVGHDDHDHEDEHDHDHIEYDEHVWTSPSNEKLLADALLDEAIRIDEDNAQLYRDNTESYKNQLDELITDIHKIVDESETKTMIVGDRFPLIYFTEEFGIEYHSAFIGCSHETEASAKTIANLIRKAKEIGADTIIHMELSNTAIAEAIAKECGAHTASFNSCHKVTKEQFENGTTYIDLMRENLETLREALL